MTTIYCKVLEVSHNPFGYIDYVVESLDPIQEKFLITKYLIVTQFPNWDHRELHKGDIGFLKYKKIIPGVDKWFDGKDMVDYKSFEGWQFIKFVDKTPELNRNIIVD
jgi:hypothetical protein